MDDRADCATGLVETEKYPKWNKENKEQMTGN